MVKLPSPIRFYSVVAVFDYSDEIAEERDYVQDVLRESNCFHETDIQVSILIVFAYSCSSLSLGKVEDFQ